MGSRMQVHQDLVVRHVSHRERELAVDVRGPDGTGVIRFSHDDDRSRDEHLRLLRRWMHLGTPLTYVTSKGTGALIDDRARFEAAFGDESYL